MEKKQKEEKKSQDVIEFVVDPHSGQIVFRHVETLINTKAESESS